MSKVSALVILYDGEPLSDYIVGKIMQEICVTAERPAEGIVVHSLNPTEVAQALCKVVDKVVYIGERFDPSKKGDIEFVTQLCAAANAEPHNIELENAMAIISEKQPSTRNLKTIRKYGLTKSRVEYIRQIYQQIYVPRDTEKVQVVIK